MKRFLLSLLGIFFLLFIASGLVMRFGLGWPLPSPSDMTQVGGGMAAKVGCSARYITGLSPDQVSADLASYSSAFGYVEITNHDADKRVEARLPPGDALSATFRPGLGCTLDIGDTSALDNLKLERPKQLQLANSAEANGFLENQLQTDNAAGLATRALLVMRDGEIIGEAYAPGFDATTQHLGWSMGKSLIAILYGRMEQEERLSVSQTELFPQWSDERKDISIENLLQMSSGLSFSEIYLPGSDSTRMLFYEYSASDVALDREAYFAPGTHWSYSSGTTNILSRLLFERLGGTPDGAYGFLKSSLLDPLHLTNTTIEPDPSGVFVGSSYVYASARDWGQLGQLLAAGGVVRGERLLSRDWIKRATTPNRSDNQPAYGYQLWLNRGGDELRWPDLPVDSFAMRGNRAQIVLMIPSLKLVFVRLGWTAGSYPSNETFSRWVTKLASTN